MASNEKKSGAGVAAGIVGGVVGGAAGTALGASDVFQEFTQTDSPNENSDVEEVPTETTQDHIEVHDLEVATNVDDSMSFSEAFASAREEVGAGGLFMWRGHSYNTYYKEEWDSMSSAEREQYWANVHHTNLHDDDPGDNYPGGFTNFDPDGKPIGGNSEAEPLVLSEGSIYERYDLDGDGVIDAASVDVDGNGIEDFVIDTDGDGEFDTLLLNTDLDENGELVYEEERTIGGVMIDDPVLEDTPSEDLSDLSAPIDNGIDMG